MNVGELLHVLGRLPAGTPVLLEEEGGEAGIEAAGVVTRMVLVEDRVEGGVPVRRWAPVDMGAHGELCVVLSRRWPDPETLGGGSMDDLVP